MMKDMQQETPRIVFQVYTYELSEDPDGDTFITKVKDTDRFIKLSGEDKANESKVAHILIETGVLPKDQSCEYLVDNQNADAIYVDKDGKPFCELRKIVIQ